MQHNYRTDIKKEDLAKLYYSKLLVKEIAAKYSCSVATIDARVREFGLKKRNPQCRARWITLDVNKIIRMYLEEHLSVHVIARRIGHSHTLVMQRLRANGVYLRHPREYTKQFWSYKGAANETNRQATGCMGDFQG
jgi:hypothetical protein